MSNMQSLNNLIEVIQDGDERIKPKLTEKEIGAILWAKQRIEELEALNKRFGANWVNALISQFELMDELYPDWRVVAKDQIKELTDAIQFSTTNKEGSK